MRFLFEIPGVFFDDFEDDDVGGCFVFWGWVGPGGGWWLVSGCFKFTMGTAIGEEEWGIRLEGFQHQLFFFFFHARNRNKMTRTKSEKSARVRKKERTEAKGQSIISPHTSKKKFQKLLTV